MHHSCGTAGHRSLAIFGHQWPAAGNNLQAPARPAAQLAGFFSASSISGRGTEPANLGPCMTILVPAWLAAVLPVAGLRGFRPRREGPHPHGLRRGRSRRLHERTSMRSRQAPWQRVARWSAPRRTSRTDSARAWFAIPSGIAGSSPPQSRRCHARSCAAGWATATSSSDRPSRRDLNLDMDHRRDRLAPQWPRSPRAGSDSSGSSPTR
jgi:hypothetical protein